MTNPLRLSRIVLEADLVFIRLARLHDTDEFVQQSCLADPWSKVAYRPSDDVDTVAPEKCGAAIIEVDEAKIDNLAGIVADAVTEKKRVEAGGDGTAKTAFVQAEIRARAVLMRGS